MSNYLVKTSSLTTYLNEINRFPLLSREEEFTLAARYREHGDIEAAHKLVTSNLKFVVKVAMEFKNYGIKLKDLIQEGNIGLMVAVKKFNPYKGYRLISYAVWWIKAYIQKFILEMFSLVKIGTTQAQRKLFTSLSKAKRTLARFDGTEPSDEMLANALDVDTKEVAQMKQRMSRDKSLDAPLNEENTKTHLELLPARNQNQEELIGNIEEQKKVNTLIKPFIDALKDKEKYIVKNRLLTTDPVTLQKIGDKFKISRERARQIEDNVKKKIKGYLTDKGFAPA